MTPFDEAFSPRLRGFNSFVAQILLLTLIFQLFAIDHWNSHASSLVSLEDSQTHVMHCHSDMDGCAGSPSITFVLWELNLTPVPPVAVLYRLPPSIASPVDTIPISLHQPPRS